MSFRNVITLGFYIGASLLAGGIGAVLMGDAVSSWYPTLNQPFWTPPSWLFGPVWTTLYVLMGTAAFLVSRSPKRGKVLVLWFFLAHLLVNGFWSIAFFTMQELVLSVVVILLLLALIIALMRLFWHYSHTATYLMVPYLVWVSYATTLAIGFLVLN